MGIRQLVRSTLILRDTGGAARGVVDKRQRFTKEFSHQVVQDHPINRIDELLPWNVVGSLRGDEPLELTA